MLNHSYTVNYIRTCLPTDNAESVQWMTQQVKVLATVPEVQGLVSWTHKQEKKDSWKLSSDLHTHAGTCPYPHKPTIGKHSKSAFKLIQEKASSFYVARATDSTVVATDMCKVFTLTPCSVNTSKSAQILTLGKCMNSTKPLILTQT